MLIDTNTTTPGSADVIDMAGGSLDLKDGQVVISFRAGDASIDVAGLGIAGAGAPNSFSFTGINNSTVVEAPAGIDSVRPELRTNNASAAINLPTVNVTGPAITSGLERVLVFNAGAGDGVFVEVEEAASFVLRRNDIIAGGRAVHLVESNAVPAADTLLASLIGNTFESILAGPAVELTGKNVSATQSSIGVRAFANNIVVGNGVGGGVLFTNVGFDADGAGAQVLGGTLTIGALNNRVQGNGLAFFNPTGDLAFTTLDIFNDNGTGLLVDTKGVVPNTDFNLDTGGGAIDTVGGTAINLDPLTVGMTLTSVSASGGQNGIVLEEVDGSFVVNGGSIANTTAAGFAVIGGTVSATFGGDISQTANAAALVSVSGGHQTGTIAFTGTLNANQGTGLQFDNADGIYNFTGATTLSGGDAGIGIVNGSSGTFSFGANTTITHNAAGTAFRLADSNANVTFSGSITADAGPAVNITNHNAGTVTFQTGTISADGIGAQGIRVAFSNGGTVNFNSQMTLSTQGNNAVTLSNNGGGIVNFNPAGSGLDITTTTGIGFSATGGGTVNVAGAGNSITSGTGTALNLSDVATTTGIAFATVNKNGTGNGILLDTVTGAGTVNIAGGTIQGALSRGVDINLGSANFTYGGTITNSASRSVEVTNYSGTANFSGAISDSGQGINLQANTGTVNFSGGLTLNTGSNIAFIASGGGGTINITGTNRIGNTAALANAAVFIANTNIGASGVTFESIRVNGGGASGIVLNNTGLPGFFRVTGIGTTDGSGGTIQSTTGSGILLTNTRSVSLSNMTIANTGLHGIQGTSVTNLDLTNVTITKAVSAAGVHGVSLSGLFGADNVFDGIEVAGFDNGLQISNSTAGGGNPDTLTIRGGSEIRNSTENGIQVTTSGTANFHLNVDGSSGGNRLENIGQNGIRLLADGGSLRASVIGAAPGSPNRNEIAGSLRGILGTANNAGQLLFTITGNDVTPPTGGLGGINFQTNDNATMIGTISGNNIEPAALDAGIEAISVRNLSTGTSIVEIIGNIIDVPNPTAGGSGGIVVLAREGGAIHATIANNVITDDNDSNLTFGIRVESGTGGGTTGNLVCLNIHDNVVDAQGGANAFAGIFVRNVTGNTFQLDGATDGDVVNLPAVEAFIENRNPGSVNGVEIGPSDAFSTGACLTVP